MLIKWGIMFALSVYIGEFSIPNVPLPDVRQVGIASWYGSGISNDSGMHGAITANGEPFNPSLHTCASRTIPLGTVVLVEDLDSGRMVHCRVNDRGPYGALLEDGTWVAKLRHEDPGEWRGIMDLSKGTALALGLNLDKGMFHIRVRY